LFNTAILQLHGLLNCHVHSSLGQHDARSAQHVSLALFIVAAAQPA
jgi:hypothetical protein